MKTLLCCALLLALVPTVRAGECGHCEHCGCEAQCCKICRCVPSTKKVTKTTYDCECEDFCVPGPSDRCKVCDACGHKKIMYTPTCATVRTRKKLVKKETTTEVPTTKWVVEYLCPRCAANSQTSEAGSVAESASDQLPIDQASSSTSRHGADDGEKSTTSEIASRFSAGLNRVLQPVFGQR